MIKYLARVLIILLLSSPAFSGVTLWGMRAETWQKNNVFENFLYVQGIFDGLAFSDFLVHGTKLSTDISIVQYTEAIDKIYADYKNALVPVPYLLRVITLELEGADQSAVEQTLQVYRKTFATK